MLSDCNISIDRRHTSLPILICRLSSACALRSVILICSFIHNISKHDPTTTRSWVERSVNKDKIMQPAITKAMTAAENYKANPGIRKDKSKTGMIPIIAVAANTNDNRVVITANAHRDIHFGRFVTNPTNRATIIIATTT
jgi:hypothetical protein